MHTATDREVHIGKRPAGGTVVERIRERIHQGHYLGATRAGDRLPSIREIADAEGVNRKTVAAAYLRLEREGLVQIRARSGIYLREAKPERSANALERLRRTWLEQTYAGALEIGLDTAGILELVHAVATIERGRFPVIAATTTEASGLAAELSRRLALHTVPFAGGDVRGNPAVVTDADVIVCTPWFAGAARAANPCAAVVPITVADELIEIMRRGAGSDGHLLLVVAPDAEVAARLRDALRNTDWQTRAETVVLDASEAARAELSRFKFGRVLLWPGADDQVLSRLPSGVQAVRAPQLISRGTIQAVQHAILDAAMRQVARPQPTGSSQ